MSKRRESLHTDSIQKGTINEDTNEAKQIDNGEIINALKKSGSHMKDLDDYLDEYEQDDY